MYLSYHTTHTTRAERRADKLRQRRSASIGQKTKRGIEGEDPAAAGVEGFFSLKGVFYFIFTGPGGTHIAGLFGARSPWPTAGRSQPRVNPKLEVESLRRTGHLLPEPTH